MPQRTLTAKEIVDAVCAMQICIFNPVLVLRYITCITRPQQTRVIAKETADPGCTTQSVYHIPGFENFAIQVITPTTLNGQSYTAKKVADDVYTMQICNSTIQGFGTHLYTI